MTRRAIVGGYGACLRVEVADDQLFADLVAVLPEGWVLQKPAGPSAWSFHAWRESGAIRTRVFGGGSDATCEDVEELRRALGLELRRFAGYHTSEFTFVHAGVVAHHGRVIVIPGSSYAGKSTLVHALVRAGAEFYSDEYAIFDSAGRVVQYREPLILRGPNGSYETEIVAVGPERPLNVGLLVLTSYRQGASWHPQTASVAEGIVALVGHALPARDHPVRTIATLRRALLGATVIRSDRGEADETARLLLEIAETLRPQVESSI